jgi:hypothetical protein
MHNGIGTGHVFPKNFIPWRDSNPGLNVDAVSTGPRRQGKESFDFALFLFSFFLIIISYRLQHLL